MIRFCIILLLTFPLYTYSTVLSTSHYSEEVLEIFSKIIPRFVLMSSQKNSIDGQIAICVLSDTMDETPALSLIEKIENNHPNGIKTYQLQLMHTHYSEIGQCRNTQLAFMFNTTDENIQQATAFSQKHSILTISYDANYLGKGVNVSLFLGRQVMPYINLNTLRQSEIKLNNILVQISKIYQSEDDK